MFILFFVMFIGCIGVEIHARIKEKRKAEKWEKLFRITDLSRYD